MADVSEEFDFGDSSMNFLVMRMGEIDKELAEITELENESNETEQPENKSPQKVKISFEDLGASNASDFDFENDDDDGALASLQGELEEFEALEEHAKEERAMAKEEPMTIEEPTTKEEPMAIARTVESTISATVLKPSPTTPVGISMKTSKGVTMIVSISEKGLLPNTSLQAGYEIVQINGVNVKNAKHARYIIQNAPEKVTFVTQPIHYEC
jgi:hypothetical protein